MLKLDKYNAKKLKELMAQVDASPDEEAEIARFLELTLALRLVEVGESYYD